MAAGAPASGSGSARDSTAQGKSEASKLEPPSGPKSTSSPAPRPWSIFDTGPGSFPGAQAQPQYMPPPPPQAVFSRTFLKPHMQRPRPSPATAQEVKPGQNPRGPGSPAKPLTQLGLRVPASQPSGPKRPGHDPTEFRVSKGGARVGEADSPGNKVLEGMQSLMDAAAPMHDQRQDRDAITPSAREDSLQSGVRALRHQRVASLNAWSQEAAESTVSAPTSASDAADMQSGVQRSGVLTSSAARDVDSATSGFDFQHASPKHPRPAHQSVSDNNNR